MGTSDTSKVFTHIEKRRYLSAKGSDALRFLNGMWTFDLKRAQALTVGAGFLLSNKGKAISEAVFLCESSNEFLLSIPEATAQIVQESLEKYLISDDVNLEFVDDIAATYCVPNSSLKPDAIELAVAPQVPLAKDKIFKADSCSWGYRVPRCQMGKTHEEWWIKKASNLPLETAAISDLDFAKMRIDFGQPVWGVDIGPEGFPLEFPYSDSISFFKGCYIGQEVIARATFRGHVTRVFARFDSETDLLKDFIYSKADPERPVGKLTTVAGSRGLGLIRVNALSDISELFQQSADDKTLSFRKVEALVDEDTYKTIGS